MNDPPLLLQSGPLRLLFVRQGDRYVQRLEICRDGVAGVFIPIWESRDESSPAIRSPADWPSSPPLQEVHLESRPDGRQIAFGVGRAGKSHWSLSVEPFTAGSGFVLDVACRVQESPQWLGSSYRRLGVLTSESVELDRGVEFAMSPDFEDQMRLEIYSDGWIACPTEMHGPTPRTIRWQFYIKG